MAVILTIEDLYLDQDEVLESSTWELSETELFGDDIIASSEEDVNNKLVKVFNNELLPNRTYYARARLITNFGMSKYSDIVSFEVNDVNDDVHIGLYLPMTIHPPEIKLDYPLTSIPSSLFRIRLNWDDNLTRNRVISSSYFIEDTEGNVVFRSVDDEDNVDNILVDCNLDLNRTYIIRALVTLSSGDKSETSGISVYVSYNKNYTFNQILIEDNNHLIIKMNRSDSFLSGKITVYSDSGDLLAIINDNGSDIEYDVDIDNIRFLVFKSEETTDEGEQEPTFTILNLSIMSCTFPHSLPYSFGCGSVEGQNNGFIYDLPLDVS